MPVTPYHFGPSGFFALVFRRWIDIPVFLLANIVVDIEVLVIRLLGLGMPLHRYCHTLLIGAAVGLLWGLAAWPLRRFFTPVMEVLRIPYHTGRGKMLLAGVLGVWLHVLIDGLYHFDVNVFWPNRTSLWWMVQHRLGQRQIMSLCVLFFIAALVTYAFAVLSFNKSRNRCKGI